MKFIYRIVHNAFSFQLVTIRDYLALSFKLTKKNAIIRYTCNNVNSARLVKKQCITEIAPTAKYVHRHFIVRSKL